MATGVPVVASDVPVNRELVLHGETGYLIPVGRRSGRADRARHTDHIFTDTALATRLASASQPRARNAFSLDAMIQQHIQLYRGLDLTRSVGPS
jgi:glycosyltransferase involved in cell wall biosynthesis